MRRVSAKTAALRREWGPIRKAYAASHSCARCGRTDTEVHEILRGVYRQHAYTERAAWLAVCRDCHQEFDEEYWTVPKQLVLKLWQDPDGFSLATINYILTRQCLRNAEPVSGAEVLDAVVELIQSGVLKTC